MAKNRTGLLAGFETAARHPDSKIFEKNDYKKSAHLRVYSRLILPDHLVRDQYRWPIISEHGGCTPAIYSLRVHIPLTKLHTLPRKNFIGHQPILPERLP